MHILADDRLSIPGPRVAEGAGSSRVSAPRVSVDRGASNAVGTTGTSGTSGPRNELTLAIFLDLKEKEDDKIQVPGTRRTDVLMTRVPGALPIPADERFPLVKILLSWSSGKDSAWALHVLRQDPAVHVAALLTTFNERFDRVAMHAVRRTLVEAQAESAGVPLWPVWIPSPCPNEIYEERMREAMSRAQAEGFTHVAFGDLFLEDVRRYREERLRGRGSIRCFRSGTNRPGRSRRKCFQPASARC